jgi:hypothetical protein
MRVCSFGGSQADRAALPRASYGVGSARGAYCKKWYGLYAFAHSAIREKEKTEKKKSRTSRKNEKENPEENRADSRPRQGLALILSPHSGRQ